MDTKISIAEISMNTQESPSVKLTTQLMI
jgi:hypothetical protein